MKDFAIGRFYRVPCVQTAKPLFGKPVGTWIPVIGPEHEDAEFIEFPEVHWHIDWRFVSARSFEWYSDDWRVLNWPISMKNTSGIVARKLLRCKRPMPVHDQSRIPWLRQLEAAYADCSLPKSMICPHRGLPLAGCPIRNGVVICPGHALAWNVETGGLVRSCL